MNACGYFCLKYTLCGPPFKKIELILLKWLGNILECYHENEVGMPISHQILGLKVNVLL